MMLGVVSKPRLLCNHVRRSYSVVPIRTNVKRVSADEQKTGDTSLPPVGDQTRTGSSTDSEIAEVVRLNDSR